MAGFSTTAKNTMLDALLPTLASLHSADPGATGANELAGGSPAYARKAITIAAAAGGSRAASTQPIFDVPAGTVAYYGLWTAGGVFVGGGVLGASETYSAQGQYQLTAATLNVT